MTREEALATLDTIPTIGEQVDALEMAINALKYPRQQCIAKIELPEEELEKIFQKVLHESKQVLPLERKTGKRVVIHTDWGKRTICSECGTRLSGIKARYCYHCGVRLDVKEVDE